MDPTAVVVASQSSRSQAQSALPGAPVVEPRAEKRRARPRRAAAGLLRRSAIRLDPSYQLERPR
jgi:hypothetical protein